MDNRDVQQGTAPVHGGLHRVRGLRRGLPGGERGSGDGRLSGLYRLDWRRRAGKAAGGPLRRLFGGRPPDQQAWKDFSETVFRCTLCGNCAEVCPAGIGLKDLWLNLRQELVEHKAYPKPRSISSGENLAEPAATCSPRTRKTAAEWVEDLRRPAG